MSPQQHFHQLAEKTTGTKLGKMFGAECLKTPNGKVAVMFWKDYLVVKLNAEDTADAMKIKGTQEFTPMDGRAMKGWYQIPFSAKDRWEIFLQKSIALVKTLPANKTKK